MDLSNYNTQIKNKSKATERGELLTYFVDRLNQDRDGVNYKKLQISRIAFVLSHLNVQDLYYLKSICTQFRNFGSTFWFSIKAKNEL